MIRKFMQSSPAHSVLHGLLGISLYMPELPLFRDLIASLMYVTTPLPSVDAPLSMPELYMSASDARGYQVWNNVYFFCLGVSSTSLSSSTYLTNGFAGICDGRLHKSSRGVEDRVE